MSRKKKSLSALGKNDISFSNPDDEFEFMKKARKVIK